MDELILATLADNKPENVEAFWEILNTGCKFAELVFKDQGRRKGSGIFSQSGRGGRPGQNNLKIADLS